MSKFLKLEERPSPALVISLLALFVFGTLLAGRFFAGWRGERAVKLYLAGFLLLCLAYFGVRLILERLLNLSWS